MRTSFLYTINTIILFIARTLKTRCKEEFIIAFWAWHDGHHTDEHTAPEDRNKKSKVRKKCLSGYEEVKNVNSLSSLAV
uniref:Putative secreted protein n=1 Tax=Ixodes ricinus TaxID=34613 RepID=A0A6B0U5B2_IXORI